MQSLTTDKIWSVISQTLSTDITLINSMADSIMQNKGKAIRSELLLNLAKSSDRHIYKSTENDLITSCAIVEMLHTGTLVHDDVIDTSVTRRGKLANHEIFGNTCSVLMGDYLFTKAFSLSFNLSDSAQFLKLLSLTTEKLVEGELLQIQFNHNKSLSRQTYDKIIRYKTAYLFSLACQSIGLFLETDKLEAYKELGLLVGSLFQMVDDYLDYFSDEQTLGKPIGGDFKERKITYPLLVSSQSNNKIFELFSNPECHFDDLQAHLYTHQLEMLKDLDIHKQEIIDFAATAFNPQQVIVVENLLEKIFSKMNTPTTQSIYATI